MKTLQRTLTIVKPDAVRRNAIGDIIEQFEKNGFRILAMKMLEITKHQAEQFYAVHAHKGFFNSLTEFMSSGPIVALALEKEDAIADLRKLMGATTLPMPKMGRSGRSGRAASNTTPFMVLMPTTPRVLS